jgi:hypothetical protein
MKKVSLFVLFMLTVLVVFGQDSTAVEPVVRSGFWGFYDKYSAAIWLALGAAGVTGFFAYRGSKVRDALNEVIKAAEDGSVSEAEFQSIVKAVKAIWGKKDA